MQMLQRKKNIGTQAASGSRLTAAESMASRNLTAVTLVADIESHLGTLSGRCLSDRIPLGSKCSGCPPMFNGKPCASTSRYFDATKGPCGCSVPPAYAEGPPDTWWSFTSFTAAFNCANNNPSNPTMSWCPSSCGKCYRLCTTGGAINSNRIANQGVCRVFKITNNCADGYPYRAGQTQRDWCSQNISFSECSKNPLRCRAKGYTNMFGYPAHFDLMDKHAQITGLGWDNPEVTFEQLDCKSFAGPTWNCQCSQSKIQ